MSNHSTDNHQTHLRFLLIISFCLLTFSLGAVLPSQSDRLSASATATAKPTPTYLVPTVPTGAIDIDVPILAYHNVDQEAKGGIYIATADFEKQLDTLLAYGYTTITMKDFVDFRNGKGTPPKKPIILTFDDGYQQMYTVVAPILKKKGMTATFFIPTGFIGIDEKHRLNNQSWNSSEPFAYHMIWPEVISLYKQGFEIGSHSVSHAVLTTVGWKDPSVEITKSRQALQFHLPGAAIDTFAYPHGIGDSSNLVRKIIQRAGYTSALAYGNPTGLANPAKSDIYAIPRIPISAGISLTLNPENPWWFFMHQVDPKFSLPKFKILETNVYSEQGYPTQTFHPGDKITVSLVIQNLSEPATFTGALQITGNSGVLVNSQTDAGKSLVVSRVKSLGKQNATIYTTFQLPSTTETGDYTYRVSVMDEYGLLCFLQSPKASGTFHVAP
jgi:peptidoglycan/xylan/chitin deacetylase (PgdA/CDA1 family)